MDAAIAEQKQAQQQFDRTITLRQTDAIPQSELDNATEFLKTATAMFGVRTQELALLEAGTRPTEIRQAQAVLEEALAATYFIEILRGIVLRAATAADLQPFISGLLICGFVVLALSISRFRKTLG